MIVTREQIAALNFGYLSGSDLLQYCPDQLLIKAYSTDPNKFQLGCNNAYAYLKAKLINRYDLNAVLSNANQQFLNQTASFQVNIAAGTYISQIAFTSCAPVFDATSLTGFPAGEFPIIDVYPTIQIGTTVGGSDVMPLTKLGSANLYFINKYFSSAVTLYFTLVGPEISVNITASTGITSPVITPVSLMNQSGNFTFSVPANTYIYQILANILLSTPSIQIGTTSGGSDVLPLTTISNNYLPIIQQYFANATTLYFQMQNGSANFMIYEALNFQAPIPQPYSTKDALLTTILAKCALQSILGSLSNIDERMEKIFEENENVITQIQNETMGLTLPAPSPAINAIPYHTSSSFKTIG